MLQRLKIKFFLNYFLGPVLFIGIALSIYHQVQHQEHLEQKWQAIKLSLEGPGRGYLLLLVGLMLVNWGIESRKWQVLLSHVLPVNLIQAFRSVVTGLAFTMITPNRVGEFIGRVFIVPDGSRIRAASLTLVGSASQVIVTLFAGAIGLITLRGYLSSHQYGLQGLSSLWLNALLAGTIFMFLITTLFYFKISWLIKIIDKIPQFSNYAYYIEPLEQVENRELLRILSLSAMRYTVFIVQYSLAFKLFAVQLLLWQVLSATTVLFLVLAIVPTVALAELGIRSKASIALFTVFSSNTLGILAATAAIWLINIIFPAIAGSLFVLGVKLFAKDQT